ncbi:MAG: GNAT family N-acetyltransferase, partial [Rubrivivax sp.]|nr:GNAT family N-acetyltransferase [Rubrivivax sp.]
FGILVRSDLQGARMGRRLLTKMIDYQRGRGTKRLVATVLRENARMLALAKDLGMVVDSHEQEPGTVKVVLELNAGEAV